MPAGRLKVAVAADHDGGTVRHGAQGDHGNAGRAEYRTRQDVDIPGYDDNAGRGDFSREGRLPVAREHDAVGRFDVGAAEALIAEIGSAWCRARVCQYVAI